jgi:acyl carrier protein
MTRDETAARLLEFIRERFLDNDLSGDLDDHTPLLEWGILNSMNTMVLLNFIRDDLGVTVPPSSVSGRNFKDVESITSMILTSPGSVATRDR